ncbi:MAG: putative aminohydrolase SsnA [Bacillota bacterium]
MILIHNGIVLTFNQEEDVIKDGAVLIQEDEIKAVGYGEELLQNYPEAETIDAGGGLIMPGLINAHMHLYSTFARGMDLKTSSPPEDFVEILEKLWWRLDRSLTTRDDLYYSAIYAILEGIEYGTTTIFDHHASFGLIEGSLDILKEAVEAVGIRASLCFEASDRNGERASKASVAENIRFINSLTARERSFLTGKVGLHASFTLEDETLQKIGFEASKLGVPCHIHVAEGEADVEDCKERGYKGVVERLDEFNIWQPETLAIHGVHLNRSEFAKLADKNVYLINNPQSNMGNAVGAADLLAAQETGLTIGLGTDGYTTDMFESLKAASILPSHEKRDPRVGGELARKMLFENNGRIASKYFARQLGKLVPGAGADVIVVDYSGPTPLNSDNYFYHLLMGVSGARVETTIAQGKVLMQNREVKILDAEKIRGECREQAADFWKRF